MKEIRRLKQELREERKRSRRLDLVVEKLEKELRKYRAQPFLEEGFKGVRGLETKLVQMLRQGDVLSSDELLSRLGIEPTEQEAVKSISKQLEILESYGLVQSSRKGWKWIG